MKLAAIAMVKNEADIVEASIRHNLAYLDEFVILENGSTDGTREILLTMQAQGLPLTILDDPIVGYFQAEKMTHMFHRVRAESRPDFLFILDADEFIIAPTRAALEARLQSVGPGMVGALPWKTYIPSPDLAAATLSDPLRDIPDRRITEQHIFYKMAISARGADETYIICPGNHDIRSPSFRGAVPLPGIEIGHFPLRTVEQLNSKVLVGWLAYLERFRVAPPNAELGYHWKRLYDRIVSGNGLSGNDVTHEALHYPYASQPSALPWPQTVVRDTIAPNYDRLHFSHLGRTHALSNVVRSVEYLFQPDALRRKHQTWDPASIQRIGGLRVQF